MVMEQWQRLKQFPLGARLFSWSLRWVVPYTGALGATVVDIQPGHCRVRLRDRRKVRNHLGSVHAIALANLCEMTSGLALIASLPKSQRAILVEFKIQYVKKARGVLLAESKFTPPVPGPDQEFRVPVKVFNVAGEHLCSAEALWKIGPTRPPKR